VISRELAKKIRRIQITTNKIVNQVTAGQYQSELSAEICAVLAFSAIRNNDQVGSILFSDRIESYIPPKKGTRHVLRVIRDLLYTMPAGRGTSITAAMDYLNRVQKRRAVVFLVSDFLDTGYEKIMRIAARRHDLVAITIEDPREYEMPEDRWFVIEDAETGEQKCIDLSKKSVRLAFQEKMQEKREIRDHFIASAGIDSLKVRTDQPYEANLYRFLKARARRMR